MELIGKIKVILDTVSAAYQIKPVAIRGNTRAANVREARQVTAYLIKEYTGISLSKIGFVINRDHSTVIHSVRVVNNEITTNEDYRSRLEFINEIIKIKING